MVLNDPDEFRREDSYSGLFLLLLFDEKTFARLFLLFGTRDGRGEAVRSPDSLTRGHDTELLEV